MARNPDDYFADLTSGGAAVEAKPRYEPAPKTPEAADTRLAEVDAAEEEIRAWAESKRAKKGGARPAPAEPAPSAAKPAEKKPRSADEYFADLMPPPAPPKAPEKPGFFKRIGDSIAATSAQQEPISPASGGLGQTADEMGGQDAQQGLAAVASKPAGLLSGPSQDPKADPMLRPEFIERVRNRFANVPAHMRLPALREYAKTDDASGRAARQILREVESQNGRITGDDERLAKRIGPLTQGPEGGGQKKPDPLQFPDPAPSFGDTMDGVGTEEVAQRRLTAQKVAEAGRPSMRDVDRTAFPGLKREISKEDPGLLEDTWGPVLGDKLISAVKLLPATSQLVLGAANFLTGGALDTPVEGVERVSQYLDTFKSREARQTAETFAHIVSDPEKGFLDAVKFLATQPSELGDAVIENLGALFVGTAGGKAAVSALNAGAKRLVGRGTSEAEALARSKGFLGSKAIDIGAAKAEMQALRASFATGGAGASDALLGAGAVFSDKALRDKPADERMLAGANTGLGYAALAKLTGAGAAGLLARRSTGEVAPAGQGYMLGAAKAVGKEGGEELGQKVVEDASKSMATGDPMDLNKTLKEGSMDLLVGGVTGAGAHVATTPLQAFLTPRTKPDAPALPPTQMRSEALLRFDELAAQFGMNPKSVAAAKQAASEMPAGEVPGFLGRMTEALQKRGMVATPIDEQGLAGLSEALDGKPEAPAHDDAKNAAVSRIESVLKDAGALPGDMPDATGLLDEGPKLADATPDAPVAATWLSAEADIPVRVVGPAQDGPDGRQYVPVLGPDGAQSFLPADELIEADRKAANDQPVVPDPARVAAGTADVGSAAGPRSGGDQRPAAAVGGELGGAAAAPVPGRGTPGAVGDGSGPDAALNAAAPVSTQAPAQAGTTEAAAPAGPTVRQLGSYGRTPSAATTVELRPNADGTLTPYTGKYPMVDYETGDPIVIPSEASDAEAVDAIRAAKAIVAKDRFYGLKSNAQNTPSAAPAADTATPSTDAEPAETGAAPSADPAAPTRDERIAAARTRIDGLKALLSCLGK